MWASCPHGFPSHVCLAGESTGLCSVPTPCMHNLQECGAIRGKIYRWLTKVSGKIVSAFLPSLPWNGPEIQFIGISRVWYCSQFNTTASFWLYFLPELLFCSTLLLSGIILPIKQQYISAWLWLCFLGKSG